MNILVILLSILLFILLLSLLIICSKKESFKNPSVCPKKIYFYKNGFDKSWENIPPLKNKNFPPNTPIKYLCMFTDNKPPTHSPCYSISPFGFNNRFGNVYLSPTGSDWTLFSAMSAYTKLKNSKIKGKETEDSNNWIMINKEGVPDPKEYQKLIKDSAIYDAKQTNAIAKSGRGIILTNRIIGWLRQEGYGNIVPQTEDNISLYFNTFKDNLDDKKYGKVNVIGWYIMDEPEIYLKAANKGKNYIGYPRVINPIKQSAERVRKIGGQILGRELELLPIISVQGLETNPLSNLMDSSKRPYYDVFNYFDIVSYDAYLGWSIHSGGNTSYTNDMVTTWNNYIAATKEVNKKRQKSGKLDLKQKFWLCIDGTTRTYFPFSENVTDANQSFAINFAYQNNIEGIINYSWEQTNYIAPSIRNLFNMITGITNFSKYTNKYNISFASEFNSDYNKCSNIGRAFSRYANHTQCPPGYSCVSNIQGKGDCTLGGGVCCKGGRAKSGDCIEPSGPTQCHRGSACVSGIYGKGKCENGGGQCCIGGYDGLLPGGHCHQTPTIGRSASLGTKKGVLCNFYDKGKEYECSIDDTDENSKFFKCQKSCDKLGLPFSSYDPKYGSTYCKDNGVTCSSGKTSGGRDQCENKLNYCLRMGHTFHKYGTVTQCPPGYSCVSNIQGKGECADGGGVCCKGGRAESGDCDKVASLNSKKYDTICNVYGKGKCTIGLNDFEHSKIFKCQKSCNKIGLPFSSYDPKYGTTYCKDENGVTCSSGKTSGGREQCVEKDPINHLFRPGDFCTQNFKSIENEIDNYYKNVKKYNKKYSLEYTDKDNLPDGFVTMCKKTFPNIRYQPCQGPECKNYTDNKEKHFPQCATEKDVEKCVACHMYGNQPTYPSPMPEEPGRLFKPKNITGKVDNYGIRRCNFD
jgi:hypothetical protein